MLTLLLTLSPKLIRLFYLSRCPLLCFSLGFIPFASWGCFQVQSNSILGMFEFRFVCTCLFHKIPQTI
jgi:hypothetical protein